MKMFDVDAARKAVADGHDLTRKAGRSFAYNEPALGRALVVEMPDGECRVVAPRTGLVTSPVKKGNAVVGS